VYYSVIQLVVLIALVNSYFVTCARQRDV
jgi:hypothetical protein